MEKNVLFCLGVLLLASCEHKDVYRQEKVDYENIAPFTSYEVPVQEGRVSIVTSGEDTLAITGIPLRIDVSKYLLTERTKSEESIKVSYSDDAKFAGYKDCGEIRQSYTLFFEDTRQGDDDYNDLIVRIQKKETIPWNTDGKVKCYFKIFPVAMGAVKNFKLGFEATEAGKEYIVAENCREELFGGQKGFINTLANTAPVTSFNVKTTPVYDWKFTTWNGTQINWFIETDTERMYIALSDEMVKSANMELFGNEKGRPYGLAFPWGGEDSYNIFLYGGPFYATEYTPITEVYGNFEDWVNGIWKNALSASGGKGINNTDPKVCYNTSVPR